MKVVGKFAIQPSISAADFSAFWALTQLGAAHPNQKINDGTFKSTFYKLASGGKRSVRRRKPGRFVAGNGSADYIMSVGLHFIRLAGGVEEARERLVGLAELIETAKEVE
jgi:hypothetical protein